MSIRELEYCALMCLILLFEVVDGAEKMPQLFHIPFPHLPSFVVIHQLKFLPFSSPH